MIAYTDDNEIELAFDYYRKVGFPYVQLQMHEIVHIFRQIQNAKAKINRIKPGFFNLREKLIEVSGLKDQILANYFHPHIFSSHAVGMRSPIESFGIDKSLRKAIKMALDHFDLNDQYVRRCLCIVNGTQMCSNFRPTAAKAVYEYIGGKDVLDMSTGYGGRLIGFLASNLSGIYTGIDPSRLTIQSNKQIAVSFGATNRVHLILGAFEDISVNDLPKVDIAFTSPPYFSKEIYDESEKGKMRQSRERYQSYDDWKIKFLKIMILTSTQCLRPNGSLAINIADVRIRNKKYPLIKDTIKYAEKLGWHLDETLKIWFPGFGKGLDRVKTEPVLIFRKK